MATGQRRALAVTLGHNHRGLDTEPSPSGHHNPEQRGAKSGVNYLLSSKNMYPHSFGLLIKVKSGYRRCFQNLIPAEPGNIDGNSVDYIFSSRLH